VAPGDIGNAFIVAGSNGHYRLAWSTAQTQQANGRQADILDAWRAENASEKDRGPYWTASGSAGSVIPHIERLPDDAKGHARFYIDGTYSQSAGATVGKQISVWVWNGNAAVPLVVRDYTFMIDQAVGTRFENGLLKVQQKKFFRTFFSCGSCEERQTDWVVRVTPDSIEDLGEQSKVPELDAVDELFDRLIKHKSAVALASPDAIETAGAILREAKAEHSTKDWKEFPTLGMMAGWKVWKNEKSSILCFATDDVGPILFHLKSVNEHLFIAQTMPIDGSCEK